MTTVLDCKAQMKILMKCNGVQRTSLLSKYKTKKKKNNTHGKELEYIADLSPMKIENSQGDPHSSRDKNSLFFP